MDFADMNFTNDTNFFQKIRFLLSFKTLNPFVLIRVIREIRVN